MEKFTPTSYAQELIPLLKESPVKQLPVKKKPLLNQEIFINGDRQKSIGYAKEVQQNQRNQDIFYVKTDDGGEYRFELIVKQQEYQAPELPEDPWTK